MANLRNKWLVLWRPSRTSTRSLDNSRSCLWFRHRIFEFHNTRKWRCTRRRSRRADRSRWRRTNQGSGTCTFRLEWCKQSPQSSWQSKHPRWKAPCVYEEESAIHRLPPWWNLPSYRTANRGQWVIAWKRRDKTRAERLEAAALPKDMLRKRGQVLWEEWKLKVCLFS